MGGGGEIHVRNFRFVLGHHLLKHKASPYNEETAHKLSVHTAVTALLHEVEHPTLPVDPDDDCFYYHSWGNNVVIAFGTLSSFLTYLQ